MWYEYPPRESVGIGPQKSVWTSSRNDLDLCSLGGKDLFTFFPRAHPLQMPIWFEFKLGVLVVIFSIFGGVLNPICLSLLCHISLGFLTS